MTLAALSALGFGREASTPRIEELFREHSQKNARETDRLLGWLLLFQWVACIAAALWLTPQAWQGMESSMHLHVKAAVLLGGAISVFPAWMAWRMPGALATRHVIAVAQALTSALLIHLSGGRIETHFHVFGSLAFLSFYRDWRVLATATAVIALDHLARGLFWPESVFGVLAASKWRWAEHAGWVVFEDVFLVRSCLRAQVEMRTIAERRATLEETMAGVEATVEERTAELRTANASLAGEISERVRVNEDRSRLAMQLQQASKLEAVGQLAAGIAHEINTPTQYVGDNTRFLQDSFVQLFGLLDAHSALLGEARSAEELAAVVRLVDAAAAQAEVDYLRSEIPKSIAESLDGLARVSSIVRSMKEFAHPATDDMTAVDLNRALEGTLNVCGNEWRYVAEVDMDFDPNLPFVTCLPGEMNQVFLNIFVNAAHAVADAVKGSGRKGRIGVRTRCAGELAEVRISDDGAGIPAHVLPRIFDHFFTTKGVGKGTGQGLSLAHAVVVKKHSGSISAESEVGKGTTFTIRIPIAGQPALPTPAAASAQGQAA